MEESLGQRLLEEKIITEKQLAKALERNRLHGGRLGQNLMALGFVMKEELDTFFRKKPAAPKSMEETGLELSIIEDLIMKHILFMGEFKQADIVDKIKLPVSVVDTVLETLRREELVEVKGGTGYAAVTYTWKITERGKRRAQDLFDICRYIGPAPVSLDSYRKMVSSQSIKNIVFGIEQVRSAFSHLVLNERLLRRIGAAVSTGKAIFIYGPAGNGKTAIAESIGETLPDTVYTPYAISVGGQIITVFDPVNHIRAVTEDDGEFPDQRWVPTRRPIVMTGGELTLKMLDLDFNPVSKFYEAPLQMKANNGLFIADDFGRQQIDPRSLLNRWIVPLERNLDFLSLHTGLKFDIPFDVMVIFSTNIEPRELVDEAFLRRIRYKFKIGHPSEEEYEAIFKKVCEINDIEFSKDVFDYLMKNYYKRTGVKLNACHPRDIIDNIIDNAHFEQCPPRFDKEGIDLAWENYFVDVTSEGE